MAGDTEFFSLFEEELSGILPPPFVEVRPQERVPQRTMEQLVDVVLLVQILDIPVPQVVDQPMAVLRSYDSSVPEQVNAVPRISSSSRGSRKVLRAPQTAEQLVEGPCCGRQAHCLVVVLAIGRLQGLLQHRVLLRLLGRSSTSQFLAVLFLLSSSAEQIVHTPARGRGVSGGLLGLHQDRARYSVLWSRSLTFQFQVVSDMMFIQMLGPQLFWQFLRALFPKLKKVRQVRRESESEGAQELELIDARGL